LNPVTVTRVRFPALDGYSLGGFLHVGPDPSPHHAVVFATGGGIRAEVYRHFLSYLASHDMAVLAFDYRGIGESRPASLRGFVAGFEDWAEYDAGGAIAWMAARYPAACLTGMGHSIGALMIGGSDDATRLTQLVFICPHTGYHGDHKLALRVGVTLCWRVLGPPLRRLLGYFPASTFGFGENLPSGVALQWAARSQPRLVIGLHTRDDAREQHILSLVREIRKPALVISAVDDPWATEPGVRRVLQLYRNLLIVRRIVSARLDNKRPIGHSGYFRRSQRNTEWPVALRFIEDGALKNRKVPIL